MSTATVTEQVCRLHLDSAGEVWFGDDATLAVATRLRVSDFLKSTYVDDLRHARIIRVLGSRENAALIVALHAVRSKNQHKAAPAIWLGSPAIVPTAAGRRDPFTVLGCLWQPKYTALLPGHWHELSVDDYVTYAMIHELNGKAIPPESVHKLATHHPAWPALSFIASVDFDAACHFICDIVDPRWFLHPFRPDRLSRLHAYLGLTPKNMLAFVHKGEPDFNYDRARNAVRVWYNSAIRGECKKPSGFLSRYVLSDAKLHVGLLRGTHKLLAFVQSVWLTGVEPKRKEQGFDPLLFFGNQEQAEAYTRHLACHNRV